MYKQFHATSQKKYFRQKLLKLMFGNLNVNNSIFHILYTVINILNINQPFH